MLHGCLYSKYGTCSAYDHLVLLLLLLRRGFLQLSPSDRSTAVDVLTANLRYICTSAQQLLSAEEQPSPETLQKHRNGLKMIVHLLHIIAMHANRDAELTKGTENAAVKPAKGAGVCRTKAQCSCQLVPYIPTASCAGHAAPTSLAYICCHVAADWCLLWPLNAHQRALRLSWWRVRFQKERQHTSKHAHTPQALEPSKHALVMPLSVWQVVAARQQLTRACSGTGKPAGSRCWRPCMKSRAQTCPRCSRE